MAYDFMHSIAYKYHVVDSCRAVLDSTERVGWAWCAVVRHSPLALAFFCLDILVPGSSFTGGLDSNLGFYLLSKVLDLIECNNRMWSLEAL